eukprot:TRINITY_DN43725_c0_g1_i1.p1 TRINITY_DN43725_c0_g1~~TRINITY_DN43725_c0_g1_i1.p1  ORF type:complete len:542 (-),score=42.41 TRINITY_DN43725_c0_g1_i1:270-1895(-)
MKRAPLPRRSLPNLMKRYPSCDDVGSFLPVPLRHRMQSAPPPLRWQSTRSTRVSQLPVTRLRCVGDGPVSENAWARHVSLSNHAFDSIAFADAELLPQQGPEETEEVTKGGFRRVGNCGFPSVRRVAIVGGGPAGLAAAIALIKRNTNVPALLGAIDAGVHGGKMEHVSGEGVQCGRVGGDGVPLPPLVVTVFEKRRTSVRRQHVYLGFERLGLDCAHSLQMDVVRLEALLQTHGFSSEIGATVEIRILEACLWRLLCETARGAAGHVAVRWCERSFGTEDFKYFDDVVGADGRNSSVRGHLMSRIPRIRIAQRALAIEFEYNCHVEWNAQENIHLLKQHRYEAWRPFLLFQRLKRQREPEYVCIDRFDFDAVVARYRELRDIGKTPFTTPFPSVESFFQLFEHVPDVQASLRNGLRCVVQNFDDDHGEGVVISPVEQTLHRALSAVSLDTAMGARPSLWLLGDSAVGLPLSKGCNLIYHMASAGRLASALRDRDACGYEEFVFQNWHDEAWRDRSNKGSGPSSERRPGFFYSRHDGRFMR